MKSIAEIDVLEQAHCYGAPSLGTACNALKSRWEGGLKDNETFIRLAFYRWYSMAEPTWYNGLPTSTELPEIDELAKQIGGYDAITAESLFILGALATGYPYCLGDEKVWRERSTSFPKIAVEREPKSYVFRNWQAVLLGEDKDRVDLRKHISQEFHARFHGRGYLGVYFLSIIGSRLAT